MGCCGIIDDGGVEVQSVQSARIVTTDATPTPFVFGSVPNAGDRLILRAFQGLVIDDAATTGTQFGTGGSWHNVGGAAWLASFSLGPQNIGAGPYPTWAFGVAGTDGIVTLTGAIGVTFVWDLVYTVTRRPAP